MPTSPSKGQTGTIQLSLRRRFNLSYSKLLPCYLLPGYYLLPPSNHRPLSHSAIPNRLAGFGKERSEAAAVDKAAACVASPCFPMFPHWSKQVFGLHEEAFFVSSPAASSEHAETELEARSDSLGLARHTNRFAGCAAIAALDLWCFLALSGLSDQGRHALDSHGREPVP